MMRKGFVNCFCFDSPVLMAEGLLLFLLDYEVVYISASPDFEI